MLAADSLADSQTPYLMWTYFSDYVLVSSAQNNMPKVVMAVNWVRREAALTASLIAQLKGGCPHLTLSQCLNMLVLFGNLSQG